MLVNGIPEREAVTPECDDCGTNTTENTIPGLEHGDTHLVVIGIAFPLGFVLGIAVVVVIMFVRRRRKRERYVAIVSISFYCR